LDEISVSGATRVIELRSGVLRDLTVTPEDFGLRRSSVDALRGGDADDNARELRRVLAGEGGAKRDAVVANAGAALCVVGVASGPREGAALAAQAIDSGAALSKLEAWIARGGPA
jgi:anthranilate phosphoribosyltransferase